MSSKFNASKSLKGDMIGEYSPGVDKGVNSSMSFSQSLSAEDSSVDKGVVEYGVGWIALEMKRSIECCVFTLDWWLFESAGLVRGK